jgi:hypothetical protein
MIPRWARSIGTLTLTFAALGSVGVVIKELRDIHMEAGELPREEKLARADGLPIEFADLALEVKGTNAARDYTEAIALLKESASNRIDQGLKAADQILDGRRSSEKFDDWGLALDKASQGSIKDYCRFDRDWLRGPSFSNLKDLGALAHLLAGRAALNGDLTDLYAAAKIAKHLGGDPVLEAELAQDEAIQQVCSAAWQIGKAHPDEELTLRSILRELPPCNLERRVGGELIRARARIRNSGATPEEMVAGGNTEVVREAYEAIVIRNFRRLYQDLKESRDWQTIEASLEARESFVQEDPSDTGKVLRSSMGPWLNTARQARKAQERIRATDQALNLLGQPQTQQSSEDFHTVA